MGVKRYLKDNYSSSDMIDLTTPAFLDSLSKHQASFMKEMEMAVVEAVDVDEQFSDLIKEGMLDLNDLHITYQAYKLLVK